jgi:hypothetical protein
MDEENEDDLMNYEESREIKETVWKVWDLLNDQEIVNKIILNSLITSELEKMKSNTLLNPKRDDDNKIKNKLEKSGNYLKLFIFLFKI